ncbi:MAG: N-acetylglucosamine-6-phosphate deacetylase [Anaerolineae bacterium]|nr:N-acetylglucosamine-6-phosphate deacetylase [Anaerolineae bacterium]MDW8173283.1 N-acetylglucosamine-6-phosphate deacetylase [Anaerolineae bacterium]
MPAILIDNAHLITPTQVIENGWLAIQDGKISAFGSGHAPSFPDLVQIIDATGQYLAPGFIDLHAHGGAGYEAMDATPEALEAMAKLYAQHGVTSFLATTWTAPQAQITAALQAIRNSQGPIEGGATLLGAHLEGPYLNPDKCGAQDGRQIRRATHEEAQPWLDMGVIKLLALAPEFPENAWLIQACRQRGIAVSAAHTSADYRTMQRAVEIGLSQTTHTFNAMTGLHHREPGTVGAALTMSELVCELIADGIHVHPAAMQVLWACKGAHGIILITDAVRGAGMPRDARYMQDGREVAIKDAAYLPDGTLAGSTLLFDEGVRRFVEATSTALWQVWPITSRNAARAIGVGHRKGSLEVGKDADLVLLSPELEVEMTIVEGRTVYQHPHAQINIR